LVTEAAKEFTAGEDNMRAYRHLYAAMRMVRASVALDVAFDLTERATSGVEVALDSPAATTATLAEELSIALARSTALGTTTAIPNVQRNVLGNILRGRIEDLKGWILLNQDKPSDAVAHFQRAVSVLPENTVWWRAAHWRLGASLEASGKQQEALAAYIKGYNRNNPDPARRATIEALYRKINGSLEGLDLKIGPAFSTQTASSADTLNTQTQAQRATTPTTTSGDTRSASDATATQPTTQPVTDASNNQSSTTTQQSASNTKTDSATGNTDSKVATTATTDALPAQTASNAVTEPARQPEQQTGQCVLAVSEATVTIKQGGSALVTLSFTGLGGSQDINASTKDWSDIVVFSNTKPFKGDGSIVYLINSIGHRAGTFKVIFKSPCGTKEVTVNVT
jgi:tetratricopeptide (TPR) repeat protein